MPLDPGAKLLMEQIAALGGPPFEEMSPEQARQAFTSMAALAGETIEVGRVENRSAPGPAGEIPLRIYTPTGAVPLPILVYFHGGGWVIGNLDSHDRVCRALALSAACVVVAVDYRLAPENKFPAAADDCYAAFLWAAAHASQLGGDPTRVAVGGDSAGGNLAAVVAQMARDRGGAAPVFQLLIYPVTDARCDTASYRENGDGYFLTAAGMRWFWNHYLRGVEDQAHPYASPLRAESLSGLPPALVLTAEFDPLRDEGEAYADALRRAGVAARTRRYDGMIHGFVGLGGVLPQGDRALDDAGKTMRLAFGRGAA